MNFHQFPRRVVIAAHRGNRVMAPENTLLAFALGRLSGADFFECDVTCSKDGQPVVFHDDTLERTTNAAAIFPHRSFHVQDFTLEELRLLDAGSWFTAKPKDGMVLPSSPAPSRSGKYTATNIPTLEEVLDFTLDTDWSVDIELKLQRTADEGRYLAKRVTGAIAARNMGDRVLLSSFSSALLLECKKALPDTTTGLLCEGIRPFNPLEACRKAGADIYLPCPEILTGCDIRSLSEVGIPVYVWTVNTREQALELALKGATGLISDDPAALCHAFSHRTSA